MELVISDAAIQRVVACAAVKLVVARIAKELVVAVKAIERIVAQIAMHQIIRPIAREDVVGVVAVNDPDGAGEREVLEIGPVFQGNGDGRDDRVAALPGLFDEYVVGVVDDISVIAHSTGHGVFAKAAIQRIVSGIAGQFVVDLVADQKIVARSANRVFDQGAQIGKAGFGIDVEIGVVDVARQDGCFRGPRMLHQVLRHHAPFAGLQRDGHIGGEIGQIIGIFAATIPDSHDDAGDFRNAISHPVYKFLPGHRIPFVNGVGSIVTEVRSIDILQGANVIAAHGLYADVFINVGADDSVPTHHVPIMGQVVGGNQAPEPFADD